MGFNDMLQARELLRAGGPVLIFLLFLSVLSIAVILERYFVYRKKINVSRHLITYARAQLKNGSLQKILTACERDISRNTPAANLLFKMLTSTKKGVQLRELSQSIIEWEVTKLQARLSILATLGSTTPFIGLFGTVIGVMRAFVDLSAASAAAAGPSVVAKGIAEALINTAAGLFVAVPAVIFYNYFTTKINFFEKELENIAEEIINED